MKKIIFLIAFLPLFLFVNAQNRTITGKVTDEKGSPLAGVTVTAGNAGTTTNSAGEFTLTVGPSVRSLTFTSVGFAQVSKDLGTSSTLDVTLTTEDKSLTEVVITGYTRESKTKFTGSAAKIDAKHIETVPVGSFDQALQGRAAGLQINSGSGQPGANAQVWIRGVQSVTAAFAQPLYVVDGVPLAAGSFQTLNPNDFESITVLKDASAASLYGSRAGTGVIVITTKKGKRGATNIQYRTQLGFTERPQATNFDIMNSSEILSFEERIRATGTPGWTYGKTNPVYAGLPATSPANNPFAASQARYDFILDSMRNINTATMDIFYRQGFSQLHELNLNGGAERTNFFLSGSYFDQEGTDMRAYLKRYTARFNIEHTADKLTVQFNTAGGWSKIDQSEGEWYGNSTRNTFQMSWRAKPYEYPYKADGTPNFGASTGLSQKTIGTALEGVQNSTWTQTQIKINSGLTLIYRFTPNLSFKNIFGVDVNDDRYQRWIKPDSYIGSLQTFGKGYDIEAYRITSQFINTSSLVYARRFDLHDIEVGGYFEAIRAYQKALGFTLFNLDPRLPLTGQGAGTLPVAAGQTTYPQTSSSAKSGYGIRSFFGTARYSYNNRYTINGTIRRDGTSRILNPENKEVTTWSLGFVWNAISEGFIKEQNWLSDLKLRLSYGSVPNIGSIPTGTYGTLNTSTITTVTNYLSPQVPAYGTNTYAGSTITGQAPTTPGNPDLKIETIQKANIGVDLGVWRNRARLSVDLYKNTTVDLFVSQPLPRESGFTTATINAGEMTNKGVEFVAGVDFIQKKDMGLTLNWNHAINENKIEDLGLVDEYVTGTFLIKEGLPYGSHYDEHYLGADPQTGRPLYETQDGKTTTDISKAGKFAKFGTFMPKHIGGLNLEFRFHGLTVATFFSYQFDVVRNNNIESWITRGTPAYTAAVNQSRRLLTQQWRQPGDNAYYQSPLYDRDFTSADLQDAKFLRFRNLMVAYQIPEISISGTRLIKSARFYVQAQNLALWSPWRGPDPEDNNNISLNEYPNPKMVVAGIDINF
ncbi:MAG TPA: SusC/RagA family TonB-linked outer membrane protein [Chitinophagaceae bacterium]